jgi:hypothetical protein
LRTNGRLGFEPRPPIAKRLERNALRLAILPLVQVAKLPGLMVRPPERLTITLPGSVLASHRVLRICKIEGRTDRHCETQNKCANNGRLLFSCDPLISFPVSPEKFPVTLLRESYCKPLKSCSKRRAQFPEKRRKSKNSLLKSLLAREIGDLEKLGQAPSAKKIAPHPGR